MLCDDRNREVVKVVPFGAFVKLLPGLDAMLHISEMAEGHTEKVEDVVKQGDFVDVQVVSLNRNKVQVTLQVLTSQEKIDEREKKRIRKGGRSHTLTKKINGLQSARKPAPKLSSPPEKVDKSSIAN